MRIAFSGSHRTGKSTLVAELAGRLPKYTTVDEPYHLMEEDGHEFAHPPSLDDFVAQLERSLEELGRDDDDVLFDRCPLDFLGYIAVHEDAESFDLDEWLPKVRDAVQTLDLVVFVPVEERDRVRVSSADDEGAARAAVDEQLREMLLDDSLELELEVLQVEGSVQKRAETVLSRIREGS